MDYLSELIGIINKIRINEATGEKEIEDLQTWVALNRDLAFESTQIRLVRMVDAILVDRSVDQDDRNQIISLAEQCKLISNETAYLYELKEFLDEIICDEEIDKKDLTKLETWLGSNRDLLNNSLSGITLRKTLETVIKEGFVSKEDKKLLLDTILERIRNTHFEKKLDNLCSKVKARKNIGIDLIDILDDEAAIEKIHRKAELRLRLSLSSSGREVYNPELIVVSLTLIAMLNYDGTYYESVRNTYVNIYKKYSEQKVEGYIRSILNRYKRQDDQSSRSRIINVVLENSIVPQPFLSAFFDFIFDIYKLNFDYDLTDDLNEDFRFVYEGLRHKMLSDGNDISVNVTQKTYKLIEATKQLIKREEGIDALINLSIIVVKLIDKKFWDKEVRIYNPYLKTGFEEWQARFEEPRNLNRERRVSSGDVRSKWEPKYIFVNNDIYLTPPYHKIKDQYDYRDISISVYNGEEELLTTTQFYIKEIIGGYEIRVGNLQIKNPLGKISYKLQAGNETIYDSKDRLFRDFIVFDEEGNELSNNKDYEGNAFICYKSGEADLNIISSNNNYNIGNVLVREGDAIKIGKEVFNFSSIAKPGIFGQLHMNTSIKALPGGEKYPVYKSVDVVVFEADRSSTKFEIVINGKPTKLSELQYKITEKKGTIKYVVDLGLQKPDVYNVVVNQLNAGKRIEILNEVFACDEDLEYYAEPIDDNKYRVLILSSLLQEMVETEVSADSFKPDFLSFKNKGIKYNYFIPLDLGFYHLTDVGWSPITESIWIGDIKLDSRLTIFDSKCDHLQVYSEEGVLVEEVSLKDTGCYKEVPVQFLTSYKSNNVRVFLSFMAEEKTRYGLYCYNKCVMDQEKTEILFLDDPKQIQITPVFHGKCKVFYEVFDDDGNKLRKSKLMSSGETDTVEEFESFKNYIIRFHENTTRLQLRKNTMLLELHRRFYAKDDFVGREFKIDEVTYNLEKRGKLVEKAHYFNWAYVVFDEKESNDTFIGRIFVKNVRGPWYLDRINPVRIELCSDVIGDTMDVYIEDARYGEGLLIDTEKHAIINGLEHPTAPDIFIYNISAKGE